MGVLDGVGLATTLSGAHRSGYERLSYSLLVGEVDEEGEVVNGHVTVAGVLAHDVGVTVLKTEVIEGGDGESSPGSGTDETVPSVLDGFTKLEWKHGGVGLLDDGEGEKGELDELVGHVDVAVHVAGECIRHYA